MDDAVHYSDTYAWTGTKCSVVVSLTIVAKAFEPRRVGLAMAWYAILSVPFHLLLIKGVGWAQADGDWAGERYGAWSAFR